MRCEFGDIVLVPFPFTDQTAHKKRPAVVISSDAYHRARSDVIVMAVTSQLRPGTAFGDVGILDWKRAGLLMPSAIKPVLATVERSLVLKVLGHLQAADQSALREAIQAIVG